VMGELAAFFASWADGTRGTASPRSRATRGTKNSSSARQEEGS
jgi:hypothetical protein